MEVSKSALPLVEVPPVPSWEGFRVILVALEKKKISYTHDDSNPDALVIKNTA
jgi:hypothetical protein